MTFATKDDAMIALEAARADWLLSVRAMARHIGKSGKALTVNDLRKVAPPLSDGVDPRVWGAVFNTGEWECLGYVKSTRRVSHGRPVAQFQLRETMQ